MADSLKSQIELAQNDSVKQKILIQLFDYHLKYDWLQAIDYCKRGISEFEKTKPEYAAFWYLNLGKIYLDQGLYRSSMISLMSADEIINNNNLNRGEVLLYIAKNYYLQNQYEESIQIYNSALTQFKKLSNTDKTKSDKGIAKTYNKLGIVYELQGNIKKSELYFNKALDLRVQINDSIGIIDSYTSLGYLFNVNKKYSKAENYFTKGLLLCDKYKNDHYFIDLHLFRNTSYLNRKNYNAAYRDLDTSVNYALKYKKNELARIYYHYAETDFASNNLSQFNFNIKKAMQYSDTFNLKSLNIKVLKLYSDAAIKTGNYKKAYEYLTEINKISNKIYSGKITLVERNYELENKKLKITELKNQTIKLKKINKIYILTILLSVAALFLLSALIFSNMRKNKMLKKQKLYFKTLFESSPFGIAVTDSTGKIRNINNNLIDILGSPKQDKILNLGTIYNVPGLKGIGFTKDIENVFKTGQLSDSEYHYVSYWKKESVIRVLNVPLKNERGEIYSIYSIVEDISKRKKDEQTIRKLSEMVKQSSISIITTDKNGIIDYINPFFTKITGYSKEDAIGKNPNILKSGLTSADVYADLWKTLKNKKTWNGEFINKTKSGKIYWVNAIVFPLKNENNEVINYIGITEDISEKKMMLELLEKKELKLKELNETKDKFFSIIAHDLKNPFGAILSLSELLNQNFSNYDEERKKTIIRTISEGAKNTYDLLENLLTWARSKRGDIKFNPKKFVLNKQISDNIKLLSEMALKKNISVIFESEDEIEVFADFNMINFIIRNLLTNALKFTAHDGEISFYTEIKNKYIQFCIKDTGIGMNAEQINNLFKIDQTISINGTDNESGTGLGLILCKDFIDFHKGKIRVQSELGKGSTFCVELPN